MKAIATQTAPFQWFIYVPDLDATTGTSSRADVWRQARVMIKELAGLDPVTLEMEFVSLKEHRGAAGTVMEGRP